MTSLIIIFIVCTLAILHTYVLYPKYLDTRHVESSRSTSEVQPIPVDVVIAAYNEEQVIDEKIRSILASDYPKDKLRILVGSDGSDDRTDDIVRSFTAQGLPVKLHAFERAGKTETINSLMQKTQAEVTILTDANVLFTPQTVRALIAAFRDEQVGLVGADIRAKRVDDDGITVQENEYLEREKRMKWKEGKLWGTMMGAFGGCYAIRTSLYRTVPPHFLVDDFHITMNVIEQGYDAVLEKEAICYEDISSKLSEEFRRKVRMSIGNFQNLRFFSHFLFHKRRGLSFSFISHKVLRWLTPIFLVVSLVTSGLLMDDSRFWTVIFYIQFTIICIPLMEMTFDAFGIRSRLMRFISYFVSMNLALMIGMFKSLKRVEKATWKPTERNL
ncbi:MAG: glycosyltransferase [Flavobacteriales bacterium]|nr:glycosyltransferase [Flavobacteriales bacterium]